MVDVDENPPPRGEQPAALPQHFDAGRPGRDVPEHIPQTRHHVEARLQLMQLLGAKRQREHAGGMAGTHARAGLQQNDRLEAARCRETQRAAAVSGADVEQRSAPLGNERFDHAVDAIEVGAAPFRQPAIRRRHAVVGGHGFADDGFLHGVSVCVCSLPVEKVVYALPVTKRASN